MSYPLDLFFLPDYTLRHMRRAWSILLAVLLGAAVVGVGTGYFLHLANQDRQNLAKEAERAKIDALQAKQDQQAAVQEANAKLEQANQEVTKAQTAIKTLQLERELLAVAETLSPAPASLTSDWQMAVSTAQGLSLKYPSGSYVVQDGEDLLAVAASGTSITSQTNDGPWLMISADNQTAKERLVARLATSTDAAYLVDGTLFYGKEGFLTDGRSQNKAAVFEVLRNGTTTHLIWMQTPPNQKIGRKVRVISIRDVISTFDFAKQP
ncbi:MAG: hypothetical protein PHW33_03670 [Candidatus Portnoybacteria bacterium]|nr:hypothetical protein [Candidatus Portnoybacteria bacterium]